jgi:hypothetical protein
LKKVYESTSFNNNKAGGKAPAAELKEAHSALLLRCRSFTLEHKRGKNRDSVRVVEANSALCNSHEERRCIGPKLITGLQFCNNRTGNSPHQKQMLRKGGGVVRFVQGLLRGVEEEEGER